MKAVKVFMPPARDKLQRGEGLDFSFDYANRRFRGHAYLAQGKLALAIRLVPEKAPTLAAIGAPQALTRLTQAKSGLLLVAGRTGSGKTTTMLSFIEAALQAIPRHALTLEDPIEYVLADARSFISQRELGRDFRSFAEGLRNALRASPDLVLVGELREEKTARVALQAAEAGCLVLAGIHAKDAKEAALRLDSLFDGTAREEARLSLSLTLLGIFAQRLLPRRGGGRVAAIEAMVRSPACQNLIRQGKHWQLESAMLAGKALGMRTMAEAIDALYYANKIEKHTWEIAKTDTTG